MSGRMPPTRPPRPGRSRRAARADGGEAGKRKKRNPQESGLQSDTSFSDPRADFLEAVLGPAAVDERPDLGAHLDLLGPGPRALLGPLRGRVDAELAAEELPLGGVVEMVERAFRQDDVALRVDVRAGVEEHLLVVVHVDV